MRFTKIRLFTLLVAVTLVSCYQQERKCTDFKTGKFEFTQEIAVNQLGESEYRPWLPFIGTLFLFIFES